MTGWLSERMQAYGELNGFHVSTIVWDGSTIGKWAKAGKLPSFIAKYKPDVVFISLGLNGLFEKNPAARLGSSLSSLKKQLGNVPFVWIGPPSWPGKGDGPQLNSWLAASMGPYGHYFNSSKLSLARASKTNPHPTRTACGQWTDTIVKWLPGQKLGFPAKMKTPPTGRMLRGKIFIYKR